MNFCVIASMKIKNLNQNFLYMFCNQCNKVTGAEYDESFVCIYCKRQNVRATPRYFLFRIFLTTSCLSVFELVSHTRIIENH